MSLIFVAIIIDQRCDKVIKGFYLFFIMDKFYIYVWVERKSYMAVIFSSWIRNYFLTPGGWDPVNLNPDSVNLNPDPVNLNPDPDPVNHNPDPVYLKPDPVNLKPDPVNLKPDPVNLKSDPVRRVDGYTPLLFKHSPSLPARYSAMINNFIKL